MLEEPIWNCIQAGATMTMPKPGEERKEQFRAMLPPDPRVRVRPMFGNLAGFVNGNMFTGLYGEVVFLRLSEQDRAELLREEGARPFAPMAGRPMREYVVVPEAWRSAPERIEPWLLRSLGWTALLPEKTPKTAMPTKSAKATKSETPSKAPRATRKRA